MANSVHTGKHVADGSISTTTAYRNILNTAVYSEKTSRLAPLPPPPPPSSFFVSVALSRFCLAGPHGKLVTFRPPPVGTVVLVLGDVQQAGGAGAGCGREPLRQTGERAIDCLC